MRNQGNPHSNFTVDRLPRDHLIDASQYARVFLRAFLPLHQTNAGRSVQSLSIQGVKSITNPSFCRKTSYFRILIARNLQSSK